MSRRSWLGLGLSLALHAGIVALALVVVSGDELLPALMIDLRDPVVPGSAPSASLPREARPAPSASTPRSKRGKGDVATARPQPSPTPPTALAAPTSEPARDSSPLASPPAREVVEPSPSGSLAGAPTTAAPPRADGGSNAGRGRGAGGETSTGSREVTSGSPAGFDHGAGERREGGGVSGPLVASVPPGAGSGIGAEYGPYLAALRQRIQQSVRYPASARRRGIAGTVSVEILILPNGTIGDVTLHESSTHSALDEAALDTIRSLPRMPLPPDLPARPLRVRVPVVFQMR